MVFFMGNPVLLDNITHKDLKVLSHSGAESDSRAKQVQVFPTEFGDVQREYPILLRKDSASGNYQSVALLGFEQGENLFLRGDDWNANYIPGIVARGPFMIGFQRREVDGEILREPVLHVDMDDPRVGAAEGEPVFLPHGGISPYLERVATILNGIQEGMDVGKAMFATFAAMDLIEPVDIQIEVHRDQHYNLQGYYTISEDKLAQLDGSGLEKLNRAGFLQGAFLLIASLNNMKKLIEMKRRRILAQKPAH